MLKIAFFYISASCYHRKISILIYKVLAVIWKHIAVYTAFKLGGYSPIPDVPVCLSNHLLSYIHEKTPIHLEMFQASIASGTFQASIGNWNSIVLCRYVVISLVEYLIAHYSDVIMNALESQITCITIAYSNVYSGADLRKHQSSASLAFLRGIHRSPVNSRTKCQ